MADFLEERLIETVRYGASWQDEYAVDNSRTSGGQEYPRLVHPFPVREFDVSYLLQRADLFSYLLSLYHRAHGTYAAFRVRCYDEWSSNGATGTPTPFDQQVGYVSAGVYELRKYYGIDGTAGTSGYPHRKIKKPVAGTVRLGITAPVGSGTEIRAADWAVDTTTGLVTFAADQTFAISGISKAAQAVIDLPGHTLVAGQSVNIAGVSGMTQINNRRALIVAAPANQITVAIDSTAFSTWTAGGVVHTRPQSGENVTAGFEFDFAAAFAASLPVGQDYPHHRTIESVRLRERLNP